MSTTYVTSLVVVLAVLAAVRFVAPAPAAVAPRRVGLVPLEWAALAVGTILLAAHCAAMFDRGPVRDIGLGGYASVVDRLGPASMVLYSVPALLVVLALRRLPPLAPAIVAGTLVAVGITMFDGGSLTAHLITIFVAVVFLALTVVFGTRARAQRVAT